MEVNCTNCERTLTPDYEFCPGCGQKTHLHRLSVHELFHDGVHYFTHADKGLFQLLRDLIAKRGIVAKEYIEGKRKKYFPPLNFFLIIGAIFVFMATLKQPKEPIDVRKSFGKELSEIKNPAEKVEREAIYARRLKSQRFSDTYSNFIAMAAAPFTALVFFLFYARAKYNYIEHLVAGMYMIGICLLFYALVLMPVAYVFGFPKYYTVPVLMLTQLFYCASFYTGFLGKPTKAAYFKALGVSFVAILMWIVCSTTAFYTYNANGFWGLLP